MPLYRKLVLKTTESLTVNEMPDDFHRFLWLMLPLIVCREGRGLDNAAWVKAKALPLRMDVTPDDVQKAMDWYAQHGIITRYTFDGYGYFFITNWGKYQGNTEKEAESIYPDPTNGQIIDNSRAAPELLKTNSASIQCNTIQSNTDNGAKNAPAVSQFEEIKALWCELFPDKPKPRSTKSITGKVKTRMGEPHFKANWKAAMQRAARSNYLGLKDTTWFDLGWFLENDTNYEKCLNGKYDYKSGTQRTDREPPKQAKPVIADDADAFFGGGR